MFAILLLLGFIFKPKIWKQNKRKIFLFNLAWFAPYFVFIIFFTGPENLSIYPPQSASPYRLPWKAGIRRFVGQGNRSFTSHRGNGQYAWDFVMLNGTEILAAREGRVLEVIDRFQGIGRNNNFVRIEHEEGQRSGYFHIQYKSALVHVGDFVRQGQPVALSGMVGETSYPHVHFVVFNKEETNSIPVSFHDVPGGVPLAGHFYQSENVTPNH
jgi:murein DD-endopeptidase MepM/ murein hydrolase activator NlpD